MLFLEFHNSRNRILEFLWIVLTNGVNSGDSKSRELAVSFTRHRVLVDSRLVEDYKNKKPTIIYVAEKPAKIPWNISIYLHLQSPTCAIDPQKFPRHRGPSQRWIIRSKFVILKTDEIIVNLCEINKFWCPNHNYFIKRCQFFLTWNKNSGGNLHSKFSSKSPVFEIQQGSRLPIHNPWDPRIKNRRFILVLFWFIGVRYLTQPSSMHAVIDFLLGKFLFPHQRYFFLVFFLLSSNALVCSRNWH